MPSPAISAQSRLPLLSQPTSQTAAAEVAWVDSVATAAANAVKSAAGAWKQMADDDVDAEKVMADDFSNFLNGFVHSYLGAATSHTTNVINEDRQAAKDTDSEFTILAQGVAAEQHDLTLDDLSEAKSAALALSPLDDPRHRSSPLTPHGRSSLPVSITQPPLSYRRP